eukprot:11360486-Alexandrium_andersonii.AAC.1
MRRPKARQTSSSRSTKELSPASKVHCCGCSPSWVHAALRTSRILQASTAVTMIRASGTVRHTSKCTLVVKSGCGGTSK